MRGDETAMHGKAMNGLDARGVGTAEKCGEWLRQGLDEHR